MAVHGLRAAEICTHPIVTVDRKANLRDVAKTMRARHVGDVVITSDERGRDEPVGILTDRDLVVHGLALDLDFEEVTAEDVSSLTLTTVPPTADLHEVVATMNEAGVRRVLVADDTGYIGIVSLDDALWALSVIVSNLPAITERQIAQETRRYAPVGNAH